MVTSRERHHSRAGPRQVNARFLTARESSGRAGRSSLVKRWVIGLGMAALAIGVFVLVYRGPGRAIIRGHVGDVAAAMLVYAVLTAAWRARIAVRAVATLGLATAIELGQLVWHAESRLGELTVGNTCDPWDIVAYVAGVGIALVWERCAVARCAACAPS